MMTKLVLVRFLIRHGHTLDIVADESNAANLLRAFSSGSKNGRVSGYSEELQRYWSVDWADVTAMFTAPYVRPQNQPATPPYYGQGTPFQSGLN